jgi:hypothetical protein
MQTPHDNSGQIDGKKAGEPFSRSREKVAPQGVEGGRLSAGHGAG